MDLTPQQRGELLHLARQVIRITLGENLAPVPVPTDPALQQPAGAFVSLHALQTHKLRGCVGKLETNQPMYTAVAHAARHALGDPRFAENRVTLNELPQLEIEITLIFPLCLAADPTDFDPLSEGIYLTLDDRAGCFLPQVARETGWDREQLLDRLCTEKMGLPARSWMDSRAKLQKFSTLLIGPEPFEISSHSPA